MERLKKIVGEYINLLYLLVMLVKSTIDDTVNIPCFTENFKEKYL
jgi:hypothetical protein